MTRPSTVTVTCPNCGQNLTIDLVVEWRPVLRLIDDDRSVVVTVSPGPLGHTCPPHGEQVPA